MQREIAISGETHKKEVLLDFLAQFPHSSTLASPSFYFYIAVDQSLGCYSEGCFLLVLERLTGSDAKTPPGRHHILAGFLQLEVPGVHVSPLRVIAFVILAKSLPSRDDLAWYLTSVPQEWVIPAFRVRNLLVAFKVSNREVARFDFCRPSSSHKEE